MPDFEIKISTPADLSGAQATQAAMVGLAQQVAALATGTTQAGQADLKPLAQSADEVRQHFSEASHAADHLIDGLKTGLSIDIGHRLVEGIAEIPRAFQEAIAEGVRFNAQMETLGIQLGGALRSADPERYLNFASARVAGEDALEKLRLKANELGTDFHALAETFAINAPILAHAGIKDIQDQIEAITLLNQVAASKGIGGFQAQRDIIDILNGTGNRTLLGKELETQGISNESIKKAEEMGTLMDLLKEKLGAYGEAGRAAADTFTASQQRLKNETEQLYGEISKPVFDELKAAYDTMAEEIKKPEVAAALKELGGAIATAVEGGTALIKFAIDHAGVLVPLGTAIGAVTFALSAYKAAQIASIIGGRLASIAAETSAIEGQTAIVEANTVAKAANATAGGGGLAGGLAAGAGNIALYGTAAFAGYELGHAVGDYFTHENVEAGALGQESQGRTSKVTALQAEIAAAGTLEEKIRAREKATALLAETEAKLSAAQQKADSTGSQSDKDRAADLQVTVQLVDHLVKQFEKLAGARVDPEIKARQDKEAQGRYDASPEGRLAKAEAAGDQGGIDDAKYDAAVDKRSGKLQKDFGFSPGAAEQTAQAQESAEEDNKEREKDAKEEESIRTRAQAEADAWTEKDARETAADEKKAAASREQAAADAKQRADAIANVNDQIAINRALAAGDTAGAQALEKKRDIQREIVRLMKEGLSYEEASKTATEEVDTANAAQDRKDADRAARHRGSADDGSYTIHGYHDPNQDTGGGLHSGGLTSSGLSTGGLGPQGQSLPSTAGGALTNPAASGFADPSAALANPAAFGFGSSPTAGRLLAPALGDLPPSAQVLPPSGAPGGPGAGAGSGAGGVAALTQAAQGTQQSGQQAAQSLAGAATGLEGAASAMQGVKTAFDAVKAHADTVDKQVAALAASVRDLVSGH